MGRSLESKNPFGLLFAAGILHSLIGMHIYIGAHLQQLSQQQQQQQQQQQRRRQQHQFSFFFFFAM